MNITVNSPAFEDGKSIPTRYTCDGESFSPPLEWSTGPEGTRSYALICDDPDAPSGTFTHWVLFDVPADVHSISEHVPPKPTLPNGAGQGMNSTHKIGYSGPCPPSGTHRYRFKVFALDVAPDLDSHATSTDLAAAMRGHILAQGMLTGTYSSL